ncbi:unnamed protein product [Sphagnum tenellum]
MDAATTSGAFAGSTLADKLHKLNASQQSIETLSHWCIFHRKKAKEIVETWGQKFHEAPREQRVPFLYLANDILQNSRRKGLEFVNEFWTVLPALLQEVVDIGDEGVRSAAFRLVDIWEERKVFGSNVRNLREELLGKGSLPPAKDVKHSSLPPYVSDNQLVFEGGILERVARSYQAVQDNAAEEDAALADCNAAITRVESLQKKAENHTGKGEVQESIAEELLAQQVVMAQCIEQLEACEMGHHMLVSHLRDALHEQESKLEQIRSQLQVSSVISCTLHFHQRSTRSKDNGNQVVISGLSMPLSTVAESNSQPEYADKSNFQTSAATIAAEVAAKLAASSSSAAMLTSVLSSLAAEEAGGGPRSPSYDVNEGQPMEKRARLDGRLDALHNPVPPQPVPPGYGAHYQPLPPSRTQFYSQPPLPSPPAPAPRQ